MARARRRAQAEGMGGRSSEGGTQALESEVRGQFMERYQETVRRLAQSAPTGVLVRALGAADELSGLAGALAEVVEIPRAHDPLARARARTAQIKLRLLDDAGGALDAGEVAQLLEISPQAVHQRRSRGTLLAVPRPNGQWVYPRFQFEPVELAQRMGPVLAAFSVDEPWTRLSVLLSRAESLGGKRPLDALREGDLEGAIEAVASFGVQDG